MHEGPQLAIPLEKVEQSKAGEEAYERLQVYEQPNLVVDHTRAVVVEPSTTSPFQPAHRVVHALTRLFVDHHRPASGSSAADAATAQASSGLEQWPSFCKATGRRVRQSVRRPELLRQPRDKKNAIFVAQAEEHVDSQLSEDSDDVAPVPHAAQVCERAEVAQLANLGRQFPRAVDACPDQPEEEPTLWCSDLDPTAKQITPGVL